MGFVEAWLRFDPVSCHFLEYFIQTGTFPGISLVVGQSRWCCRHVGSVCAMASYLLMKSGTRRCGPIGRAWDSLWSCPSTIPSRVTFLGILYKLERSLASHSSSVDPGGVVVSSVCAMVSYLLMKSGKRRYGPMGRALDPFWSCPSSIPSRVIFLGIFYKLHQSLDHSLDHSG